MIEEDQLELLDVTKNPLKHLLDNGHFVYYKISMEFILLLIGSW